MRHSKLWALVGGLVLVGACVLQTETVSGPKGEPGEVGPPGLTTVTVDGGVVSIQALADLVAAQQQTIAAQQQAIANLKNRVDALADPDCPAGYMLDATETKLTACKKGSDEVVKVGAGGSAFWIDRYEASVFEKPDGNGTLFGVSGDDYPPSFPKDGQRTPAFVDLFAVSRKGVSPSSNLTWFQAQQACRASGKRLPTGEEWLAAASGTPDPTTPNDGSVNGECVTSGPRRMTGTAEVASQTACISAWGAEDMIGNVWEWTADWFAAPGTASGGHADIWPYANHDTTNNIMSGASTTDIGSPFSVGLPAGAQRGGASVTQIGAGVFALSVDGAPSSWNPYVGFRCAVSR